MTRPAALDALAEAARDEWSDPRAAAIAACQALLTIAGDGWEVSGTEAVSLLRQRRRDSPLMLAVSEAAMWQEAADAASSLEAVLRRLEDTGWAHEVAVALVEVERSIHVMSLGEPTTLILEELTKMTEAVPLVTTHRVAVARGLGYLDLAVSVADPAGADVLLMPVAAAHGDRIWSTPHFIEVAGSFAGTTIPVHHPLAEMSPLSRQQYRPPPALVSTRISRQ